VEKSETVEGGSILEVNKGEMLPFHFNKAKTENLIQLQNKGSEDWSIPFSIENIGNTHVLLSAPDNLVLKSFRFVFEFSQYNFSLSFFQSKSRVLKIHTEMADATIYSTIVVYDGPPPFIFENHTREFVTFSHLVHKKEWYPFNFPL